MLLNSEHTPPEPGVSLDQIADKLGNHYVLAAGLMYGNLTKSSESIQLTTDEQGNYLLPDSIYTEFMSWVEAAEDGCRECLGTGVVMPLPEGVTPAVGTRCSCWQTEDGSG